MKLPVFLFCVAFITLHNRLFGEENSIIAVILLTGIFMLMRGNFGYQSKQAAAIIPVIFLLMVTMAKLSLWNSYIGILINFFTVFTILILKSHDLTQGNHVPFLMEYLFCQGYDVTGTIYRNRIISVVIGGILIAVIYYIANHKKVYRRSIKDLYHE